LPEDKSNDWLRDRLIESGAKTKAVKVDLSLPENPSLIFNSLEQDMGPITAIILSHCHDVSATLLEQKLKNSIFIFV